MKEDIGGKTPKKSGGIIGMLINLIMLYAIVIGSYYGYKKYKESTLCTSKMKNMYLAQVYSKQNFATWVDNEMNTRGITLDEAIIEFAKAYGGMFKKGQPYDLSTVLNPIPACTEDDLECIGLVRERRIINACKENVGGFRLSTLYFGDGFYNYPRPPPVGGGGDGF
tara:strand:- start:2640 stop:3140 length:501 start_codon:yes stop_codon:yes gene_type:complete